MDLKTENEKLKGELSHYKLKFAKMRAAFDSSLNIKSQYEQLIVTLRDKDPRMRAKVEKAML